MTLPTVGPLIWQTSSTTGTGDFTLSSLNGFRDFSDQFAVGATPDTLEYLIRRTNDVPSLEWERGTGHLAGANSLVRDRVIEGSNGTGKVNFSAGTKDVTCFYAPEQLLQRTNARLEYTDTTTLTLYPDEGDTGCVWIDGRFRTFETSVTAGAPPAAETTYALYAYMSSGAVTLEASTTAALWDVATGVYQKSGDTSRTLVGAARSNAGSANWQDNDTQNLHVRSSYGRDLESLYHSQLADRATTSASYVEASSVDRMYVVALPHDHVAIRWQVHSNISSGSQYHSTLLAVDGILKTPTMQTRGYTANAQNDWFLEHIHKPSAVGRHYYSLFHKTTSGTVTLYDQGMAVQVSQGRP